MNNKRIHLKDIDVPNYGDFSNDNAAIIQLIINFLSKEIIPDYDFNLNQNLILEDKKRILELIHDDCNFTFLNYGTFPIKKVVDSYEFYLYLLSHFNKVGNLYFNSNYIDDKLIYFVSISYYNKNSKLIEINNFNFEINVTDKSMWHMFQLIAIKSIVTSMLYYICIDNNIVYEDLCNTIEEFEKIKNENEEENEQ